MTKPHLLYPLVHDALTRFLERSGASGVWLADVERFPGAFAGKPFNIKHALASASLAPAGKITYWLPPEAVEGDVRPALEEMIDMLQRILPRTANPPAEPLDPPN